ncbi:MAG: glycine oxidase ThiO [Acidobacteria bacterium]|nr:glycine oxidase ThiO [Acidobacteriota bacterium]
MTNSDVLIIGGGVIGLAIARELRLKGVRKIAVLERGAVGREASHAAAGMLAPNAETEKLDEFYRLCDESNRLYPDFAAALFAETGVDVGFDRQGTLYLALTENDSEEIGRRFAWQRGAGLRVERLSAAETRRVEPFLSPDVRESLFFPEDRQVETRRLVAALERFAALNNIEIRERTSVARIVFENGRAAGAETEDGEKFFAGTVVLAAGAWSSQIAAGALALPAVKPVRGQIVAFQTAKRLFQRVIYSPRGYLVPRADGRVLAGATSEDAGFDKSVTTAAAARLRANALEIAPSLVNLEIVEQWAGLRPLAADRRPVLGSFPQVENFLLATAHFRNGILLAPVTARIIAEKIAENRDSDYLRAFGPERFRANDSRSLNISA